MPILCLILIQESIVCHIDKELAGGTVWIGGTSHCQRKFTIFYTVASFILNRAFVLLLLHVGREAATLNHESTNDAMKNRTVVEAFCCVVQEILRCLGSFFRKQFDADVAVIGFNC